MTSSHSATFAAHVPTITALRNTLRYGDARLSRCTAFNDTLLVFRKNYVTSTGLRGSEIHDWKLAEHQAALTEMSQAFLDRDGNGELYWPSDPKSLNYNALQYKSDPPYIRHLVKQLIYRLNVQQYRNAKYKRKGQSREDDYSGIQHQAYPSIEVSSDDASARSPLDVAVANTQRCQHAHHHQPGIITSSSQSSRGFQRSSPPLSTNDEDDELAFAVSRDFMPPHRTQVPKRALEGERSAVPPKRRKLPELHSTVKMVGVFTDDGSSPALQRQSSPRGMRTMPRPERAPTDEFDDAIASPNYTPAARPVRQTPEDVITYIRNNRPSVTSEASAAVEHSNVSLDPRKEPPIDPALEHIFPRRNVRVAGGRDGIGTISSRDSDVTIQTKSNYTPTSLSPATSSQPFQSSKEKTAAGVDTPSSPNPAPKAVSAPANAHKPNVEFTYRVILTRKPIYQYEKWKPQGNFQDKSLAELQTELPIQKGYEALVFRLRGPGTNVEETIKCDREDDFKDVKRHFNKIVRSLALNQARTKPGEALSIRFEIEPLRSNNDIDDDDDDEAELADFAW